ncbi:MFS transporter [Williamwhitmania taraxaci]|uniref:Maltose/moltooligosaccharide transporter n=1 Tax=Williamwhitmania taraxaci TaxID=1640674 RepID=A0A1G6HTN0_9BACT|nr:MFS transporter [Williamwhitmania taraxaci]SDB97649.1 maltose/moltooligosaccharide transporter [Williamwhitmania taraxaci]
MAKKPHLSFWQIWNLSFGFLGVQIGYSLQNGNTSRILSSLGADVGHLSYFWLAAPLAGLLVQPIIGLSSDKTWTRLGRRVPFILGGAIASALAMFFMPNSEFFTYLFPPLIFGAVMLLFMDTSFNVTMQPFRALVGDMVNDDQRNIGYSVQSFLINTGAVLGSILPFLLTYIGVSNIPAEGAKVAPTVIWAFYIGGAILLITVLWTSFTTKEFPPKEYEELNNITAEEKKHTSFLTLLKDIPETMWRLSIVQFFSWFSLFLMWVYTTSGIAQNVWGVVPTDSTSAAFNAAGNWTGVIFACYSAFAAGFSMLMPRIARIIGRKNTYRYSLLLGGLSLLSMIFIKDQYMLIFAMAGVGISWAAILAMPYAILSSSLPASKMGVYMGIFNASITIPQIAAGLLGGVILALLGGQAIFMLGVAGLSMVFAAIGVFFVHDKNEIR